jgi:hypothetical protein
MSYTPGPWTQDRNRIEDQHGHDIAVVSYRQDGYVQANARLIASAPAMADLLRRLLTEYFDPTWPDMHFGFPEEIRQVLAAIAKAEGREGK